MSITDNDVEVYDNTFMFDDCVKMIKLFSSFSSSGISNPHSYFRRNNKNNKSVVEKYNNPFEYMIDDYLTKMGDETSMVEYWYRTKWLDIKCHQDLNEYCLTSFNNIINPHHGHIMYLSEYTNQAATVMFNVDMTAVTLIYPKIGRIVRFNGKCQHAVPNPLDKIFNNNDKKFIEGMYRHVLLFNTWDDYIPGPDEPIMKCKIIATPKFLPKNEWKKVPLFDTIHVRDKDFLMNMNYMGDSSRRVGSNISNNFFVNKRILEDGYHQQMISYEILNNIEDDANLKDLKDKT